MAYWDGQKAIEAFNLYHFDIVLMDIQMPLMDGFEATAGIRKAEGGKGTHIPIIAMTADVMKGAHQRYLSMGMDDFIPKPIIAEDLYATMEKWLKTKTSDIRSREEGAFHVPPSAQEVLLQASLGGEIAILGPVLEKHGDDMDFFRELAEIFMGDTPDLIRDLAHFVDTSDAKALERTAHKLKGACGNFGLEGMYDLFVRLQTLGKENKMNEAASIVSEVSAMYNNVEVALRQLLYGSARAD